MQNKMNMNKLIEQLKGTFGKYYDYHRRDIAADEVDYLVNGRIRVPFYSLQVMP